MHFKSALIIYALYFVTSAWSVGLNSDQLIELKTLVRNYKKSNRVDKIGFAKDVEKTLGMKWENAESMFEYNSNDPDLHCLLKTLANMDKSSDKTEVKILDFQEVNFLLDNFNAVSRSRRQQRFRTRQQLFQVFYFWRGMNRALSGKLRELESGRRANYVVNAVECLWFMLEIKKAVCANGFMSLDSGDKSTMKEFHGKTKVNFLDFVKRTLVHDKHKQDPQSPKL
ncbi:uncharacterized protein LOC126844686 [Adelges cooleyi]|uniref:uncharacterized protein LOC126844686 n=1 Tax=Adelges cooleyi TaxID=133065 RepID=UPI00217F7822|nr:uncharacterized protein LOC126844686 [Adelges cooleyi]